ncbi:MAG: NAD(P)/FAD-dependent oxidoreductase, partial [Acidobacteriota bacterium]|nr:NAD(P)/FAD-dependent oxidoreductase [Acidobacteriota bacterium]
MTQRYDVIVIGAGHNGLTAGALLAKRGRRVLIVEARDVVGGLAAGEEFHPGYRTTGILHDTSRVRSWVVELLALESHGLSRSSQAPQTLVLGRGGSGFVLDRQEVDNRHIEWRRFLDRIRPVIQRLADNAPADLLEPAAGDLLKLARAAVSIRLLGKTDMMELLRIAPMSVADWLGERFASETLKAALAAPAVYSTNTGPRSPGSNANLLLHESLAGPTIRGGPAALVTALEKAARSHGAEIRTEAAVERISLKGGKVSGVRLLGGEEIEAATVAASCDPKQIFLRLVPGAVLSRRFEAHVQNFRCRGTTAKIHLALTGYPEFSSRSGQVFEHVRTGASLDDLERASDAIKYRRFSDWPVLDISFPTIESPELAPRGHHVASVLVHFAPFDLGGGWSQERNEELYRAALAVLSDIAPGIEGQIVGREVSSPADIA